MKVEINYENKSRFLGTIIGCPIVNMKSGKTIASTYNTIWQCLSTDNDIRPELKPLSAISDEDAIECGFKACTDMDSPQYAYSPSGVMLDDIECIGVDCVIGMEISDILRAKGYALPWMGLSVEEMVEAGWIKLIEP